LKSNDCERCGISLKDPLFWETHQTMADYKIWCKQKINEERLKYMEENGI
jgi:hypothetical protein